MGERTCEGCEVCELATELADERMLAQALTARLAAAETERDAALNAQQSLRRERDDAHAALREIANQRPDGTAARPVQAARAALRATETGDA